jgi:hypothetical protein
VIRSRVGVRSGRSIAAVAAVALAVAACAGSGDEHSRRRAAAPPIHFDSIGIASSEGDCALADGACARVEILYPLAESETHAKAVDAIHRTVGEWILGRPGDDARSGSPDTVAAQFIASFLEFRRANPTLKPRWTLTREARVVLDTLGVVTLHGVQEDFAGGVHGNTNGFWTSFDLESGDRIGIRHLVAPADTATFRALVEATFRKTRELGAATSLADSGFFSRTGGRFTLPENIGITRYGIVLHYNQNEIAAYAAGPTTVMVPWTALRPLIRADSPAARFLH